MQDWLALYRVKHPTTVLACKCMDGRLNLPLMANMPTGVIEPFRNIGGKFDLGAPYFGRLVLDAKERAIQEGRLLLAMCTYHFSKGDPKRGCAGHNYDTDAARAGAMKLKAQFERVFEKNNPVVSAIVVGVETDEDSFTFHNGNSEAFAIADHLDATDEEIADALAKLYGRMQKEMLHDLLPIALGNRDHVRMIRSQKRPVTELVHGENIICVGRGFGWLHLPNKALIIGPYDHAWGEAVKVAGRIVSSNIKHGRVPASDGALLLISAPYWGLEERRAAEEKASYLHDVADDVLRTSFPELAFKTLVGVTDMKTRLLHEIKRH